MGGVGYCTALHGFVMRIVPAEVSMLLDMRTRTSAQWLSSNPLCHLSWESP